MGRFGHVLRRAELGLRVPRTRRARILEEVGHDLEDAYRAYRARGLEEAEAALRAERLLGLSEAAVSELERLHATPYARLLNRFSTRGAHRFERGLLTVLAALAVVVGGGGIVASGGPRADSIVVWVLLALLAVTAALLVADRLADLRGAVPPASSSFGVLIALAVCAVVVATLGAVWELWGLAGAGAGAEAAGRTTVMVAAAVGGAAEVLALGVIVALVGFLAGFHLRSRRRAAVRRRSRIPGLADSSNHGAER